VISLSLSLDKKDNGTWAQRFAFVEGKQAMFFKKRRVLRELVREGFHVEQVWLDALSTHDEVAYVGLKLIDEPIPDIARLDLRHVVADWGNIALFSPVGRDAIIVLLVVKLPEFCMAVPT